MWGQFFAYRSLLPFRLAFPHVSRAKHNRFTHKAMRDMFCVIPALLNTHSNVCKLKSLVTHYGTTNVQLPCFLWTLHKVLSTSGLLIATCPVFLNPPRQTTRMFHLIFLSRIGTELNRFLIVREYVINSVQRLFKYCEESFDRNCPQV